jgi:hypothetical protein
MALGITIRPLRSPAGSLFKGRKVKLITFVGDNAMPSGGYVVTAAQCHLRIIEGGIVGQDRSGALLWTWTPAATTVGTGASSTNSTNQATLLPYSSFAGSCTASATIVSSKTVEAFIYGV